MLIQLHGDVLSFNIGAMQSFFRASRILLSPKFYYTCVLTKASLGVRRSERAIQTEEIVELRIGVARRKVLYETRRRARGWERSWGSSWGVRREHEKDGWGYTWDRAPVKRGKRSFGFVKGLELDSARKLFRRIIARYAGAKRSAGGKCEGQVLIGYIVGEAGDVKERFMQVGVRLGFDRFVGIIGRGVVVRCHGSG